MRVEFLALFAIVAGCDNSPTPLDFPEDSRSEIAALKAQVEQLQKDLIEVRVKTDRDTWANLRTNEQGYSVIDAGEISLVVSLKDVKESASGSKVTLQIGNPSTATITRLHLNMSYGKATEEGLLTNPIRNKVENITTRLPPGKWTSVTVGLPDAPPQELGIVRINGALVESLTLGTATEPQPS